MKLVTVAEMRALEAAAVEAGVSLAQLMEEAGLAVAQEAWMLLGTLEGRRITVLAGPGNNGGDGLVAARHLADWGAEVAVALPAGTNAPDRLAELREREVTIAEGASAADLDSLLTVADLLIDALLGIGKARPLSATDPIGMALERLAAARQGYTPLKVLAVDLPSGMDADSGAVDPLTIAPDLTVTFGLPKVGMYQAPASAIVGRVQVIDIGIPKAATEGVSLELLTSRWAKGALPARPDDANKGAFGRLLIVGGCERYPGAPRLAATGAYRAGAGLVTVACPRPIHGLVAAGLAEATWLPLPGADDGGLRDSAAIALRPEWPAFDAAVFGPGLGNTEDTRALTWAVLPDLAIDLARGVVIDADALNALAAMPGAAERVPANAVLTPHPGEMARLMQTTVADVQSRRLEVAREAAARFGCTIVLKGAHSVVAAADGGAALSPFANPLLASAGSGDVLAGMIGAYLAQGLAPFDAARLGVYLHAAAGESLREDYGNSGLLAGEIAARLPRVAREIGAP